jgi:hypothetical protein
MRLAPANGLRNPRLASAQELRHQFVGGCVPVLTAASNAQMRTLPRPSRTDIPIQEKSS